MVHHWTLTIEENALRGRVDPDLFFPCVLRHIKRTWREGRSTLVAFRKTGLPFAASTGGKKPLLLMKQSIRMMILGCFTASTFSSVESLSHLILAPL